MTGCSVEPLLKPTQHVGGHFLEMDTREGGKTFNVGIYSNLAMPLEAPSDNN